MSSVQQVNPNAEVMKSASALFMNINAAKGLYDVMKTNLGPRGTIKMLVGGAGDIKLTKDGNILLREMQIQNPTAVMIARCAVAQDEVTGDGTTTCVLLIGALMKGAERHLGEGVHARVLAQGYETAAKATIEFLENFKVKCEDPDKELLTCVARSSLRTKVYEELAEKLTNMVTDAVLCVRRPDEPLDLHMVEIMTMRHRVDLESRLIRGLVLDHGCRHPDMPKRLENCFILTCNISLEYEKSEVNSGFFYSSAEQRESMVAAEREYTDKRVREVIALKKKVCDGTDKTFVVINQKGIDPLSLDLLAKEGIMALRRCKRRNMERLVLACGGEAVNQIDPEMGEEILGYAGCVYEHTLGEDVFTFVEDCKEGRSCTLLLKGPNDHTIAQMKDAVRDGLRAVKNVIDDKGYLPGAGAFEVAASQHLLTKIRPTVKGRAKLGVAAFAEALLTVPKTLAETGGFDAQDTVIAVQDEHEKGNVTGVDVHTGEPMDPVAEGVYDCFIVKKQLLAAAPVIAQQLLLVDEVMRAGMNMRKRG